MENNKSGAVVLLGLFERFQNCLCFSSWLERLFSVIYSALGEEPIFTVVAKNNLSYNVY